MRLRRARLWGSLAALALVSGYHHALSTLHDVEVGTVGGGVDGDARDRQLDELEVPRTTSSASVPTSSSSSAAASAVILNTGAAMPTLGFGTAGLGDATRDAVRAALRVGYRLLDTSGATEWYREDLVGDALAAEIAASEGGLEREDVFVTSKLHPRHFAMEDARVQVEKTLRSLRVEYVDLFLLHYPRCWGDLCGDLGAGGEPRGTWRDAWRVLETMRAEGKIRALGVSNFDARELSELRDHAVAAPSVVQRRCDVFVADRDVREVVRRFGWTYQAYSSLGTQHRLGLDGASRMNPVLSAKPVVDAAEAHGVSPADVALRWALQSTPPQAVIPRSSNEGRIRSNFENVARFELSASEMATIDALDGTATT